MRRKSLRAGNIIYRRRVVDNYYNNIAYKFFSQVLSLTRITVQCLMVYNISVILFGSLSRFHYFLN